MMHQFSTHEIPVGHSDCKAIFIILKKLLLCKQITVQKEKEDKPEENDLQALINTTLNGEEDNPDADFDNQVAEINNKELFKKVDNVDTLATERIEQDKIRIHSKMEEIKELQLKV